MFAVIPSLDPIMQALAPVFTAPSFQTHLQIFLGWSMCLGKRTEFTVFRTIYAEKLDRKQRHPFDRFYNFFNRSAWTLSDLARGLAVHLVARLNLRGRLYLVVDSTLLHKRGKHVYGLGWFRDAVASTKKRVATASGNHWVVLGLAIRIPRNEVVFCLPIYAMLHMPGKGQKGEAALAREMLRALMAWLPDRNLVLLGDGGFANKNLLKKLDRTRVTFIGVIRSDAAVYDPTPAEQPAGKRGPKPKKGARLPSPREAAKKANRAKSPANPWAWKTVTATAYGVTREFLVVSYQVVWPNVAGTEKFQVLVVRDPKGKFSDKFLFTTDLTAEASWLIQSFARRWSIEVAFKASKQLMKIECPQHWSESSIKKLAPWVWLMQSVISIWYLTEGKDSDAAVEERELMGEWESEWSFAHMFRILRKVILRETINAHSGKKADMQQLIEALENHLNIAI